LVNILIVHLFLVEKYYEKFLKFPNYIYSIKYSTKVLIYRNYLNSMRNTSIVSLLLALLVLLAPIAEAETIKIVSYLPVAHLSSSEDAEKSPRHDHLKSI
jgi:hypothetical protein